MQFGMHIDRTDGRAQRRTAGADRRGFCALLAAGAFAAVALPPLTALAAPEATALLQRAYDNWRSKSSKTTTRMTIHRPTWERTLTMKGYSRGMRDALVRFVAPPRDAGNATLKLGNRTWVFNPKLNQVVKLPASLLGQSWMGSDFSYNDLSRADDVLRNYTHRIIATGSAGGHKSYTIEAMPKAGAPVVWGKQVVKVRDDGILLGVTYYDQDMKPVREMTTDRIRTLGGRPYPAVLTMKNLAEPGKWTRLETREAQFDIPLPDYLFTRSNLSNPRD